MPVPMWCGRTVEGYWQSTHALVCVSRAWHA